MKNEKLVLTFPEEREILRESEVSNGKLIPKSLRKEILTLYKLGLEEYEIRYLIALKQREIENLKWEG